ncbi:MAG: glycosyltransferase [Bacteroidales bacterium]
MMVSVCMITYNHEKYIAQAIEGVVMQNTNFDFELVIGEDCSLDATRKICLDFKEKYPEKIRLLLNEKNLGMMPNFIQTLNVCNGKYIALCEGDDYWTDPKKLQKQVDLLENNSDFVMSFHNTKVEYDNGQKTELSNNYKKDTILTIVDLIKEWNIMTASLVFKNVLPKKYPDWFYQLKNGDYGLELLLGDKGQIYYHNIVMAAYRKHVGGISNLYWGINLRLELIKLLNNFNQYSKFKYKSQIKETVKHNLMKIKEFYTSENCGIVNKIKNYLIICFLTIPLYKYYIRYYEKKK